MSGETAFLRAILDNLEDDAPRLIYADWLDEYGDPESQAKAEFVRLTAEVLQLKNRKRRRQARLQLSRMAESLDVDWLAIVSRVALEECRSRFDFQCPKQWERLQATKDVRVRFCTECRKSVHYCDSIADAQAHAERGECVAVRISLPRHPNDLHPVRMMLGGLSLPRNERLRTEHRPANK